MKDGPNSKTTHKECRTCFFTTGFPGITINESGECTFCANRTCLPYIQTVTDSDLEELRRIAKKLKEKKTGKYDCIIGGSGGLDSSYVIYVAKKLLDLNPLVVNYDNGFVYDIAKENLTSICKNLGVDLRVFRSKKYHFKHLKYMALSLRNIGIYWGFCQSCRYLLKAVLHKIAIEENISTVLVSNNPYEQVHLFGLPTRAKLKTMFDGLFKPFSLTRFLKLFYYFPAAFYYYTMLKLEFYIPPFTNIFRRDPKSLNMEEINITKYIPWNLDQMLKNLEEIGWKAPDPMLPMRFDCKIDNSFIGYTYKKMSGYNTHVVICHNLICDGTRTKSQLKPSLESLDNCLEQNMEQMMKSLGVKSESER